MASTAISHIILLLVMVSSAYAHFTNETDAYHDMIHFIHGPFTEQTLLSTESLEEIYHEMFEKAECEEKAKNCSLCFSDFMTLKSKDITTLEQWNNVSVCQLYALLDMSTLCNMTREEKLLLNCEQALLASLNAADSAVIGEEEIELLIHKLSHDFSSGDHGHHDHAEEVTQAAYDVTEGHHDHGDHEGHDHDHDHTQETTQDPHHDHDHDHEGHNHTQTSTQDPHHDHDHNHNHTQASTQDPHHDHDHDHNHTQASTQDPHHDHDHDHNHTQQTTQDPHHDHDHDHNHTQQTTQDPHHDHDHDHDHGHDEHGENAKCFGEATLLYYLGLDHGETSTLPTVSGILISFLAQDMVVDEACEVEPKPVDILSDLFTELGDGQSISEAGFENILETLAIGSVSGGPVVEEDGHEGHDHSGHDHKRSIHQQRLAKRSTHNHDHDHDHDHPSVTDQCMNEGTLASVYGLDLAHGISRSQFLQLCPALIQQKVGGHCDAPTTTSAPITEKKASQLEVYGYGVLSVFIISLLALLGALFIPFLHKQVVKYALNMFVAMGVLTMLADALLHLMPQSLGLHDHGASEGHEGHDHEEGLADYTVSQLVVCIAIYVFFIFESVMARLRPRQARQHNNNHGHSHDFDNIGKADKNGKAADISSGIASEESIAKQTYASKDQLTPEEKTTGIPSVALMILVGDGIHNFIDGLAIGAAFSQSLQDGLGTSIAVFCHELPHELGDFSILLQSGMTKCKAILFNLLSASMCMIGLFVGIALGANQEIRTWLIALTAGMFIYVALVDMLPELMTPKKEGSWWIYFLVQNIGMIIGITLMLLIAVYEETLIHLA